MENTKEFVLHSRYDPKKEAKRFLEMQNIAFSPKFVVVTEPGESYLATELRKQFPNTKLIAIRYQDSSFYDTDCLWDAVWRPGNQISLSFFLFNLIPDEYIPLTVYLNWKPSDSVWPEMASIVHNEITIILETQKKVMITRVYFGPLWFKNMIKNACFVTNVVYPPKMYKPFLIVAAGPSLEKQLSNLPKDQFCICAVSSAIQCLLHNHIKPDMCMSTDGGYWSLPYLIKLPSTVPLLFPLEAAIPASTLDTNPVILLNYGSAVEQQLFSLLHIESVPASRNGTVSGTAAMYAYENSCAPIYAAGLDLCTSNSFAHARPHESEIIPEIESNRFNPIQSLVYERNHNLNSMDVYASWFASRNEAFKARFFRLGPVQNNIPGIETRLISDIKASTTCMQTTPDNLQKQKPTSGVARKKALIQWLEKIENDILDLQNSHIAIQEKFVSLLKKDPIYAEVFQMISYIEYIHALQGINARYENSGVERDIHLLAEKTAVFLCELQRKIHDYA